MGNKIPKWKLGLRPYYRPRQDYFEETPFARLAKRRTGEGMLFSFDGIDGVGKSTQVRMFQKHLEEYDLSSDIVRETELENRSQRDRRHTSQKYLYEAIAHKRTSQLTSETMFGSPDAFYLYLLRHNMPRAKVLNYVALVCNERWNDIDDGFFDPDKELIVFSVSRLTATLELGKRLNIGKNIILDRSYITAIAYRLAYEILAAEINPFDPITRNGVTSYGYARWFFWNPLLSELLMPFIRYAVDKTFLNPDLAFILIGNPDECHRRIIQGRKEVKPNENVQTLSARQRAYLKVANLCPNSVIINTDGQTIESIQEEIFAKFAEFIRQKQP